MEDNNWHLDKRVPIALIAAILVQTGAVGLVIGQTLSRVAHLETKMEKSDGVSERLARLEAASAFQVDTLRRIEARLYGKENQ
jgi:hypothetical protein